MPFQKMQRAPYPPRLWSLVGFPGSGKSTFAAAMRAPILVVDADQRFQEVIALAGGDVFQLSETPSDHTDPERIAALLAANMPGAPVKTIVIDSLTTIIAPLITQAVIDNDAGRNKNRMAGFKDKALTMRLLQDSVTKWGADCLWIYHLQQGRDAQANAQTTATVSETELARLTRCLNLKLEVVQEDARRGIKVAWARRGRAFPEIPVLWDSSGRWAGMPEKLESAVYDGLTVGDQERRAATPPAYFAQPADAWAWGFEQGVFKDAIHSKNAYELLKREKQPTTPQAMRDLWVADIDRRRIELGLGGNDATGA